MLIRYCWSVKVVPQISCNVVAVLPSPSDVEFILVHSF